MSEIQGGDIGQDKQNLELKTPDSAKPLRKRISATGTKAQRRVKIRVVSPDLQGVFSESIEAEETQVSAQEPENSEPSSKTDIPGAKVPDILNTTKEKGPLKRVDVIGQKDKIIPVLEKLTKIDIEEKDNAKKAEDRKVEEAAISLLPLWEGLDTTPKNVTKLWNSGRHFADILTYDAYAFSHFEGQLEFSAIFAAGAFENSKGANVSSVLAISNKAFGGIDPAYINSTNIPLFCVGAEVANSIIYGKDIFKYAEKGVISHSIIGGEGTLTNSHDMRLVDTYEITADGVYYYPDAIFNGRFVRDEKYRVSSGPGTSDTMPAESEPSVAGDSGQGKLAEA